MYKGLCDYIMKEICTQRVIVHDHVKYILGEAIAKRYGLTVKYEYYIYLPEESKNGYIDLTFFKGNKKVLAIELDSSYKYKSLKKLSTVDFPFKLWVCFARKYKPDKLEMFARLGVPICTRFVRLNGVD